jgi:hypothetical protein
MKDYPINRWFRIRTGVGSPVNEKGLSVEIDINTVPEKETEFDLEKIKVFYTNSFDFAKKSFLNCFGESL